MTINRQIERAFSNLQIKDIYVIDKSLEKEQYLPIDLSSDNEDLDFSILKSPNKMEAYIDNQLRLNDCKVAFGGYLEQRNLYKRSDHFSSGEIRDIHLGVDLWCASNTPVLAVLDGKIHSFQNNTNFGDYGPTLILEHEIDGYIFYSLYGHLSLDSIVDKKKGQPVEQGEQIGTLGSPDVNGNYAPHLHFQLIINLEGKEGDYPGVASRQELEHYRSNCPNPNLILGI